MIGMRKASFLVLPSECYEGFAVVIAEAFCQGLPVIASRLGAMAETIVDGQLGLLFAPGDASDLAAKVRWAADNPTAMATMGRRARRRYEERYSPRVNYDILMRIYEEAVQEQQKSAFSDSRYRRGQRVPDSRSG
jgi:glycosyltransferase involved in cell wall biosynthesis